MNAWYMCSGNIHWIVYLLSLNWCVSAKFDRPLGLITIWWCIGWRTLRNHIDCLLNVCVNLENQNCLFNLGSVSVRMFSQEHNVFISLPTGNYLLLVSVQHCPISHNLHYMVSFPRFEDFRFLVCNTKTYRMYLKSKNK